MDLTAGTFTIGPFTIHGARRLARCLTREEYGSLVDAVISALEQFPADEFKLSDFAVLAEDWQEVIP